MQAVGIYLKLLREGRGMTTQVLADTTGLNNTYIWRVESGDTEDPGVQRMVKILEVLQGKWDHVAKLLTDPAPTEDYIRELARQALLTDEQLAQAELFLATDEETRILLEAVHEKAANPALRNRMRGYVDSLSVGDGTAPDQKPPQVSRRKRKK